MRILQINQTFQIGSTGKLVSYLGNVIRDNNSENYVLCAYSRVKDDNVYVIGDCFCSKLRAKKNILRMWLTGRNGYTHKLSTKKAVEWIKSINPDIIHLHNIHGNWINLKVLFSFLKESNIPVVWTLHDCWSFTGRCSHFENANCFKWRTMCHHCKNKKVYPKTFLFDFSKKMFRDKKKLFLSLNNLTFISPSKWLASYFKQSFLNNHKITVIPNGIDMNLFKPSSNKPSFFNDFCGKRIILGVASSWSIMKGLHDFIKLDAIINHSDYQIVLIGLNERQIRELPSSIVKIGRTNSQQELINAYSNAYVLFNPTYQDNFPTVNLEAIACGCPVVTYKTGGSVESIMNPKFVLNQGDFCGFYELINSNDFQVTKQTLLDYSSQFNEATYGARHLALYESVSKRL